MGKFVAGDRVRVADDFFWAMGATGIVATPPDAVTAISGRWDEGLTRQEISALGTNRVYWVWFDEPEHNRIPPSFSSCRTIFAPHDPRNPAPYCEPPRIALA